VKSKAPQQQQLDEKMLEVGKWKLRNLKLLYGETP
jgi:hypothetical protein